MRTIRRSMHAVLGACMLLYCACSERAPVHVDSAGTSPPQPANAPMAPRQPSATPTVPATLAPTPASPRPSTPPPPAMMPAQPATGGTAAMPMSPPAMQPSAAGAGAPTVPPEPNAPSVAEVTPEPGPSAGCASNMLQPGRSMRMIESGGMQRTYLLYVPPSYDGKKPVPIVVDHHGGGATSMNAERSSGFKELADREGFLWVAPDGLEMSWGENARDGDFVLDIIALLERTACVDRKRIYSTGCSMGAGQTNWLACNRADVFAAVMPVCGTTFFDLANQCMPSQPMPTMLVIGRDDELNCWDAADEGSKPTRCVDTYRNIFKDLNGCTGAERTTHNGNCITVDQCTGGVEVVTCGVAASHVAYFATDMKVTEEGWKFLSRFYRER